MGTNGTLESSQMETILADHQRLKKENAALRRLLVDNGIALPAESRNDSPTPAKPPPQTAGVDDRSDKDAKIALFRELFRGRQDVYAVRTQFKSGDWGYVPASIHDCKAVLSADAARRKKVDQKTRKLLPITDDIVRQHLEGKQTIIPKLLEGLRSEPKSVRFGRPKSA